MSNDPSNSITQGVHHAGLTVPDLGATRAFFVEGLGFEQVGEKPDYPAVFLSDGGTMITLWQVEQPETATSFDRHNNIGLHHARLDELHDPVLPVERQYQHHEDQNGHAAQHPPGHPVKYARPLPASSEIRIFRYSSGCPCVNKQPSSDLSGRPIRIYEYSKLLPSLPNRLYWKL